MTQQVPYRYKQFWAYIVEQFTVSESRTKFINIVLVPVLIAVGGILLALHRTRRRKAAAERSAAQQPAV